MKTLVPLISVYLLTCAIAIAHTPIPGVKIQTDNSVVKPSTDVNRQSSLEIAATQRVDSIYYLIPASVKTKILDHTKELKPDISYYVVLSHQSDTTSVLISRYGKHPEELSSLIKSTNRYIKLNASRVIPVLVQTDFLFSSLLHSVQNEGQPYAIFKHKLINPSGFLIEYFGKDEKARIVREEFYQN